MSPFPSPATDATAVLIPVKAFELAKDRLADALPPEKRSALAKRMAQGVVAAAAPLPVFVVCNSDEVVRWAVGEGAKTIRDDDTGLNAAVAKGVEEIGRQGYTQVIVAHGDLPLARSLAWLADFDGVTVVPDRRGDGTNVLVLPTGTEFTFHYGTGSAAAHLSEAARLDLDHRTVNDHDLGWDVDTPDDLAAVPPLDGDG
jgi:2-phospho-L-lactate guanylyltransferase